MNAEQFLYNAVKQKVLSLGYYPFEADDIADRITLMYRRNLMTSVPLLLDEAVKIARQHYGKPRVGAK